MSLVDIKILGSENIAEIQKLFKENKTKHWPIRLVGPDMYRVTLRADDPMSTYIQLKYLTS